MNEGEREEQGGRYERSDGKGEGGRKEEEKGGGRKKEGRRAEDTFFRGLDRPL